MRLPVVFRRKAAMAGVDVQELAIDSQGSASLSRALLAEQAAQLTRELRESQNAALRSASMVENRVWAAVLSLRAYHRWPPPETNPSNDLP